MHINVLTRPERICRKSLLSRAIVVAAWFSLAACTSDDSPRTDVADLQESLVSQARADTAYFEGSRRLWDDAQARGVAFRAIGQEPGWLLEIRTDRIMLSVDYDERRVTIPAPAAVVDSAAGTTTWTATTDSADVRITAYQRACADAMSGEPFPLSVTVVLDGKEYNGCGRSLEPLP